MSCVKCILVFIIKMQEIETINVRIPKEIVNQLDSLLERNIYKSRSELIRVLLREELSQWKMKKEAIHGK